MVLFPIFHIDKIGEHSNQPINFTIFPYNDIVGAFFEIILSMPTHVQLHMSHVATDHIKLLAWAMVQNNKATPSQRRREEEFDSGRKNKTYERNPHRMSLGDSSRQTLHPYWSFSSIWSKWKASLVVSSQLG